MAADANIFAQYLRPVKSMQDFTNDMDLAEGNKLALASKRMQMQQAERGAADEAAVRGIVSQYGSDKNELVKRLYGGGYATQAQGIEKGIADAAKARGEADKTGAETDEKRFKLAKERRDAYEQARGGLERDPALTKDKVVGVISGMVDYGMIPAELAQKLTANLPDEPEALRADIRSGNLSRLTPEQMVTLFTPKFEYQDSGQQRIPVQTNMNVPGAVAPQTIQKVATPGEVMRSEDAAKTRAQSATQHSQTLGLQRDKFNADQAKPAPVAGQARTGPMSVTMQKELLEADDTVQSAGNVVNTLKSALKINDKAYSGYFAKGRAQVVSNLGGTDSADATIDIDNMMTGQALESLKVVFGGMPTEGERKILLEMQASADKTPEQRKAIMTRAIAAAERRAKYAGSKAKAIRGGTYLTEGAEPAPESAPETAGAISPEDTRAMDWANKNPNDPRAKQIKQRLGGG